MARPAATKTKWVPLSSRSIGSDNQRCRDDGNLSESGSFQANPWIDAIVRNSWATFLFRPDVGCLARFSLIDLSMKSPDKLPLFLKSFKIFLKSPDQKDRVSLVVDAGRQAVLLEPTSINESGRKLVSQALQKLSAGGGTNGAAGISTACELTRSGFIEGGVNRVVLATDGDFNVGTTDHAEFLDLVRKWSSGL